MYKTQKFDIGNGFVVYSVSLDNDLAQWEKAIGNDRLSWSNQVCDFKKWDSPIVEKYNFRYLPHNVLIDQNGVIVAKGLYGSQLDETLKEHLAE
ncbi:thioredoxin family protein [Bacteroidia bacterium]|nr:thioredoxin family protein [Bacteroidia bacterium]